MAQHAVRVPVTRALSAAVTGYLPVHCFFHMMKARIFAKHKVSVKVILSFSIVNLQHFEQFSREGI